MKLKTFIVEDNATIRENLIATLEELANIESVGIAETESDGTSWLSAHHTQWDLAIVDPVRGKPCRSGQGQERGRQSRPGGLDWF